MLTSLWVLAAAVTVAAASCPVGNMDNLVAFGDSYTDESRKAYFAAHGEAPPPGTLMPESNKTSSGGYTWGRFVAQKTDVKYYNYAVGGATCSNDIVSRRFAPINAPYPSVLEYQLSAYEADIDFEELYPDRHKDNTVYALFIGTNDLGIGGFLNDANVRGTDLSDYVECNWETFDHIYQTGGRRFVLFNTVPLDLAPTYRAGAGDSAYWPNHSAYPQKQYQYKMERQTKDVKKLFDVGANLNVEVLRRWPGASVTIFDVHALFADIYDSPDSYLAAPGDALLPYRRCDPHSTGCVNSDEPWDSFLWYDELHPSEKAAEIIADNFIDVIEGKSRYGRCVRA